MENGLLNVKTQISPLTSEYLTATCAWVRNTRAGHKTLPQLWDPSASLKKSPNESPAHGSTRIPLPEPLLSPASSDNAAGSHRKFQVLKPARRSRPRACPAAERNHSLTQHLSQNFWHSPPHPSVKSPSAGHRIWGLSKFSALQRGGKMLLQNNGGKASAGEMYFH